MQNSISKIPSIQNNKSKNPEYIVGLDILRIVAAVMIAFFHINVNLNFRTGFLWIDTIISVGANFMVLFFMISGFLFSYKYNDNDLLRSGDDLRNYYKSRLLRIYPAYLLSLLIVLLFRLSFPKDVKLLYLLIPVDLLMLQAHFPKAFSYIGNGGTWFVSVLIFLYFIFPFLLKLLQMYKGSMWKIILALYLAAIYVGAARLFLGGDFAQYYANPIFRVPEFLIGMILGKIQKETPIKLKYKSNFKNSLLILGICLTVGIVYCAGILIFFNKQIAGVDFFKKNYLSWNFLLIPLFTILIVFCSGLKMSMIPHGIGNILEFGGKLSFYFYITQGFANRMTQYWLKYNYFGFVIDGDKKLLFVAFALNILFSLIMFEVIEKGINPIIKKAFP